MNSESFQQYINLYYGNDGLIFFPNEIRTKENLPFKYSVHPYDLNLIIIKPLTGCEKHFSPFAVRRNEFNEITRYCQYKEFEKENYSDLEHVIQHGCISFTSIGKGETYAERNQPLFYTDEQLKYCIRKYGSWKVFKEKFKYNFHRRIHFLGWWICNLFGLNLYSKNEVTAAVYQACQVLRKELGPDMKLEDKIIQQIEKKSFNDKKKNLYMLPLVDAIEADFENRRQEIQKEIKEETKKINRLQDFN